MALVFSAVKQRHEKVDTFVIFGAVHTLSGPSPAVYDAGAWRTPLGTISVDEDLARAVVDTGLAVGDPNAHRAEHSIEVQLPFIQHLFPDAGIVPVVVPPGEQAIDLGAAVGGIIDKTKDKKVVCIGSTDLTHYGPSYYFTPMGVGARALQWATEVNDRRFIDSALTLDAGAILAGAVENGNACGPGAAAATVAAAKVLGRAQGVLLAHITSNDVMRRKMGGAGADSVGYAAIIY